MSDPRTEPDRFEPARLPSSEFIEPVRPAPVRVEDLHPQKKRSGLGVVGALVVAALAKGKSLLLLLKALPAGKFLLTTLSMGAMVWFEAQRSGILFGVGFVLMILIHELGHGYAMKRAGVQSGWPIFIPFFGAMIAMKSAPKDRRVEAEIAFGGPLAGAAVSLLAAGLGLALESRLFVALAYTGCFLNLFNLIPMSPLDGGRVTQAFSRRAWMFGAALLVVLFFFTHAPMLLMIGMMALPRLLGRVSEDERPALEPAAQRAWAVRYFGLASLLAAGSYLTSQLLHQPPS